MGPLMAFGAMAGLQLFSGILGGAAQKRAMIEAQKAQNEAAKARNKAIALESARQVGEINRQRTVVNDQTNRALQQYGVGADTARSDLSVMLAMSDRIGSTSKILMSDIERQESEVLAITARNHETEQLNLNSQLEGMINNSIAGYSPMQYGASRAGNNQILGNILQVPFNLANTYLSYNLLGQQNTTGGMYGRR